MQALSEFLTILLYQFLTKLHYPIVFVNWKISGARHKVQGSGFPSYGHLEKIYENALVHRLRKKGLEIRQQHPIKVHDEDGTLLGDYYADIFAENQLIVEIKGM